MPAVTDVGEPCAENRAHHSKQRALLAEQLDQGSGGPRSGVL